MIDLVWLSPLRRGSLRQVNLREAKTHLSRLVADAVAGEGLVIRKAGKPLVQVTRLEGEDDPAAPRCCLGLLAGQCSVPDDCDQMAAGDIAPLFEGRAGAEDGEGSW